MTTPETLAAMLTDDELRQRIAESEAHLWRCDGAVCSAPVGPERDAAQEAFQAALSALRVLRAEQERRQREAGSSRCVHCVDLPSGCGRERGWCPSIGILGGKPCPRTA